MQTQTKLTLGLAALCVAGWVSFFLKSSPSPVTVEKIVTQEVVKYVDRVVTRDVVRTETRPDGTKIVTETKVDTKEHTSEQTKTKQITTVSPSLTKYSLGVAIMPQLSLSDLRPKLDYQVEIGRRVYSTPFWVTLSYNTKREWLLGVRGEL